MEPHGKSHAQLRVQERTGREVDELLRDLYVVKRHSHQEIAAALGIHRRTVADWLRDAGITRDDRPAVAL